METFRIVRQVVSNGGSLLAQRETQPSAECLWMGTTERRAGIGREAMAHQPGKRVSRVRDDFEATASRPIGINETWWTPQVLTPFTNQ